MTWSYTGTAVYYDDSSPTTYRTGSNDYTRATACDYLNDRYFTIPFQTHGNERCGRQEPLTDNNYYRMGEMRQPSQPCSVPSQAPSPQPSKPSPEEIEAKEKARKQEIEAQEKAQKLLLEYLDQDNKQKYFEKKPIEIFSELFNDIKYQIPISKLDKICALKDGKIVSKICLTVKEPEQIPLEDVILTKLLYFLNDEECALRTAHHTSVNENLLARLN